MKWILLVWMIRAGGITSAEFNSLDACRDAGNSLVESSRLEGLLNNSDAAIRFICEYKGSIHED